MNTRLSKSGKTSGASIAARFPAEAKRLGVSVTALREQYAREAFFRRLAQSEWREKFILKGSVLLVALLDRFHRPTIDADFLLIQPLDDLQLREAIGAIARITIEDQVIFDPTTIRLTRTQETARIIGQHLEMKAILGHGELIFRADLGFNDVIVPKPEMVTFPGIMSSPISILGSTLVTVIAEKYDAMVDRGIGNTRAKDFFDLAFIARTKEIGGPELVTAIRATFGNRGRALPYGWSPTVDAVATDPERQKSWDRFCRQNTLNDVGNLAQIVAEIRAMLDEPLRHVDPYRQFAKTWTPGRGWA